MPFPQTGLSGGRRGGGGRGRGRGPAQAAVQALGMDVPAFICNLKI